MATTLEPKKTDVGIRPGTTNTSVAAATYNGLHDHTSAWVNVRSHGATGDGSTNDTAAVAEALAALPATGGTIMFPPGTFLCNIAVDLPGVTIRGAGSGDVNSGNAATKIVPYDVTQPALKLGTGTTLRRGIRVQDLSLVGTGSGASSDGLYMIGVADVTIDNVHVTGFGRDNVSITSGSSPTNGITFAVFFSNFHSSAARGSGFKAVYGPQWVTSIQLVNSHINGYTGGTAMWLDGVEVHATNLYVDVPSGNTGTVRMAKSGASTPRIAGIGVNIDAAGGGDAVSFTDVTNYGLGNYFVGSVRISGYIRWPDTTTFSGTGGPAGTGTDISANQAWLYSVLPYFVYFPDQSAAAFWDGSTSPTVRVFRADYGASTGQLRFENTDLVLAGNANSRVKAGTTNGTLRLHGNRDAGDSGSDVIVESLVTRTLGDLFGIYNNGTQALRVRASDLGLITASFIQAAQGLFPGNFGSTQSHGMYAGTGVPSNSNGTDGDFYLRTDGTAAGKTLIYHRESGAWVAAVP